MALFQWLRQFAQRSEVAGSGNFVVQIVGDGNTVVGGHPYLRLTRYFSRRHAAAVGGEVSEAALISPYTLNVPMLGREAVSADLWRWLEDGRAR